MLLSEYFCQFSSTSSFTMLLSAVNDSLSSSALAKAVNTSCTLEAKGTDSSILNCDYRIVTFLLLLFLSFMCASSNMDLSRHLLFLLLPPLFISLVAYSSALNLALECLTNCCYCHCCHSTSHCLALGISIAVFTSARVSCSKI